MIMKAKKSQGQQSADWRLRRVNCLSFNPKASSLQIQVQRQEKTNVPASRSQARGASYLAFLFYSDLLLIGWGPHKFGRVMCFTQSTDSRVNLI